MTHMTSLLERNEQFARGYTPSALGVPARQMLILTCLDHRVDPAIVLRLRLGDAPVIRNAGGRVTQAVIDDIAYLAFLAGELFGGQGEQDRPGRPGKPGGEDSQDPADALLEIAVVHHTQCGTGLLADPGYRHRAAQATGLPEAELAAAAVTDPRTTVRADVGRLLAAPSLSPRLSVSGHVYDIATGRVTTVLAAQRARRPASAGNN